MLTSPWFSWNDALVAASKNAPPIRKGYIGYPVRILQQALIHLGLPMPRSTSKFGSPDGVYGSETRTKVIAFQKKHKLSRDGVVGQNTMAKLDDLVRGPWTPPRAIGGPGDVKNTNSNAKMAVLNTLRGNKPQNINFIYKGTSISSNDFIRIGEAVYYDDISVEVGHVPGGMAVYFPADNRLRLTFFMSNSPKRRSTIIHELTHAALDRRSLVMSTLKSESIAWIAQCLYLRLCGIDSLTPGFGGLAQDIYLAANDLAREWRTSHRFSDTGITALETALRRVPHYNHGHDFQGDGI